MLLNRMTADEICELKPELAILPVGSIEQHGPHLPVTTDWLTATALGEAVAKEMGAFSLPALPVSTCREHMGKMGSVWMNPDTFYHMIMDICMSLKEQGFKKVAILQCHGGIFAMTPAVRELNSKLNPDFMVARIDSMELIANLRQSGVLESRNEIHAGECETSLIMYLHPELVHNDKLEDFVPDAPRDYLNYGSIFRASPKGIWGQPTLASAEKGKKIFEANVAEAVQLINKAFDYMESKEKFGYSWF